MKRGCMDQDNLHIHLIQFKNALVQQLRLCNIVVHEEEVGRGLSSLIAQTYQSSESSHRLYPMERLWGDPSLTEENISQLAISMAAHGRRFNQMMIFNLKLELELNCYGEYGIDLEWMETYAGG